MTLWPMYRPQDRTFNFITGDRAGSPDSDLLQWWRNQFLRTPEISTITAPNRLAVVRTADTRRFETLVRGDMGEPIVGAVAEFSIAGVSSEDVALSQTFPGGFSLANYPVDTDSEVINAITAGTPTLLVKGVDYSLVDATGVGTWITDQTSSDSVEASWSHATNPVTANAHGTLLTVNTITDNYGRVETRVRYPGDDDLVGTRDRVTVVVEDI